MHRSVAFAQLFLALACFALNLKACKCNIRFRSLEMDVNPPDGIWDEVFHNRIIADACECGTGGGLEDKDKPWNVFVHSKVNPNDSLSTITCSGTIITSNFVVTSHICLTLIGRSMKVYDSWKPKLTPQPQPNMVPIKDIIISQKINETAGDIFSVEDIIYNPQFGVRSSFRRYPMNDVAIIKVKADFTTHPTLWPICIPAYSDLDLLNQRASYYGASNKWSDIDPIREIRDAKVLSGKACDDELDIIVKNATTLSNSRTLCIKYSGGFDYTPELPGGPLILNSTSEKGAKNENAFLIGVATRVRVMGANGIKEFDYFSNIVPVIRYLEHQANQHGSSWCKTQNLKLKPKLLLEGSDKNGPWPWEIMRMPVIRNESLNCVCGITNQAGRIVGGDNAAPYEFGWMSLIHIYINGRHLGGGLCGGAIINNRLILTAAHCLVSSKLVDGKHTIAAPHNVDVSIRVHLRRNDTKGIKKKVAKVLYHPKYTEAIKSGYFDYDIALLVLKEPLEFVATGNGIRPVCLPTMENLIVLVGRTATVTGWGLTSPDDEFSTADALQKLDVPIIDLSKCSDVATNKVTERFICAGTLNKMKDAARGDSGGPLMIKNNTQWTEVGIVSWGEEEFKPLPGKERRTAAFYSDIQKLILFVEYHSKRLKAKWCRPFPYTNEAYKS